MTDVSTLIVAIPIPPKVREELIRHPTVLRYHDPSVIAEKLRIAIGRISFHETIDVIIAKIINAHLPFFKSTIGGEIIGYIKGVDEPMVLLSAQNSIDRYMRKTILEEGLGIVPFPALILSLLGELHTEGVSFRSRNDHTVSIPFLVEELELILTNPQTGQIQSIHNIALEDNLPLFRESLWPSVISVRNRRLR
ncbi:hypothetical protein L0663_25885 [Dyadobacter sp. CY107]|uniref:hypothetical protein n=1 Tax=Dyadobacter fanqingshengii TaxID=2906443 RepID=UPI001F2B0D0B|nr:hypothetical protein [Dyadobacter fanqingshengii]MCF2506847.1 hypothetical protein [Dyadobacter fanqingshengii]